MNGDPDDIASARTSSLPAAVARLIEQRPVQVAAALGGDHGSLVALLRVAADVGRPPAAGDTGDVEQVAETMHRLADGVASCYSTGRAPSDRLCDLGFALADQVEALAVEVAHQRALVGGAEHAPAAQSGVSPAVQARHLARAHVAALRDAAAEGRLISSLDVDAAQYLYQAVVALGRAFTRRQASTGLIGSAGRSAAPTEEQGN